MGREPRTSCFSSNDHLSAILALSKAWDAHERRVKDFKDQSDATKSEEVSTVLALAGKTVIEYDYWLSCVNSLTNHSAAKTSLNKTIKMMGEAEMLPDDIRTSLWLFVSKVIKGDSLTEP